MLHGARDPDREIDLRGDHPPGQPHLFGIVRAPEIDQRPAGAELSPEQTGKFPHPFDIVRDAATGGDDQIPRRAVHGADGRHLREDVAADLRRDISPFGGADHIEFFPVGCKVGAVGTEPGPEQRLYDRGVPSAPRVGVPQDDLRALGFRLFRDGGGIVVFDQRNGLCDRARRGQRFFADRPRVWQFGFAFGDGPDPLFGLQQRPEQRDEFFGRDFFTGARSLDALGGLDHPRRRARKTASFGVDPEPVVIPNLDLPRS